MKRIASVLLSAAIIGATPFVCETYSDLGTNISVEAASVIDTPKYASVKNTKPDFDHNNI